MVYKIFFHYLFKRLFGCICNAFKSVPDPTPLLYLSRLVQVMDSWKMNVLFWFMHECETETMRENNLREYEKNARAYAYYGIPKQVTYNEIKICLIMEGEKSALKI